MKSIYFNQDSRLGRTIFELRGPRLSVTKKGYTIDVDLREVAPHFERIKWRSFTGINTWLAIAMAIALITRQLRVLPEGLYTGVAMFGWMLFIGAVWKAARFIRPLEFMRYRSRSGNVLFDVIKEKNQAVEFEKFVEELQRSVLSTQENMSQTSPLPSPASGADN